MKFPARVTLRTATGEEYVAEVDAPVGAPGRPLDETDRAVRRKFRRAATGVLADPEAALDAVLRIDEAADVRDLVSLLTSR
jgi:2-methylcitrate dehydratase PrpD